MESLFANYASSDEEEEEHSNPSKIVSKQEDKGEFSIPTSKSSAFFSSLPPPKSYPSKTQLKHSENSKGSVLVREDEDEEEGKEQSWPRKVENSVSFDKPTSLFSSIPQSKSKSINFSLPEPKSSSIFSFLPPPKTSKADPLILPNPLSSSDPKPKRIVQFKPPVNLFDAKSSSVDEDEEEDEDEKEKQRKRSESIMQTPTVKSFLSSIPAPKNSVTLGALSSGSGTGRRSIIDADVPVRSSAVSSAKTETPMDSDRGYNEGQYVDGTSLNSMGGSGGPSENTTFAGVEGEYANWGSQGENYVNNQEYAGYGNDVSGDYLNPVEPNANHANYSSSYGNYSNYGHYENNWADGSTATAAPEIPKSAEAAFRIPGKRGRKDAPPEIIEVSQDDLMKNRPREDQAKVTGIAFGPSYQPVSTKGKPTKLHKRKHQIGSLYFDMKQKEMELTERRAQGMQTKAQTQGKYGW